MAIHIRRRQFIVTLSSAAAWPLAARAQPATRLPRIGWRDRLSCIIPIFSRCIPRWTEDAELH